MPTLPYLRLLTAKLLYYKKAFAQPREMLGANCSSSLVTIVSLLSHLNGRLGASGGVTRGEIKSEVS